MTATGTILEGLSILPIYAILHAKPLLNMGPYIFFIDEFGIIWEISQSTWYLHI